MHQVYFETYEDWCEKVHPDMSLNEYQMVLDAASQAIKTCCEISEGGNIIRNHSGSKLVCRVPCKIDSITAVSMRNNSIIVLRRCGSFRPNKTILVAFFYIQDITSSNKLSM